MFFLLQIDIYKIQMKSLDNNLDPKLLSSLVDKTVSHYDDGELFIEKMVSNTFL